MNSHKMCVVLAGLWWLVCPPAAQSQDDDKEPVFEQLMDHIKKDYLSIGAVLQIVGDMQPERTAASTNGFSVANARISARGKLDGAFGYVMQANFISSPAIIDANIYFEFDPRFRLTAGRYKAPFSGESLTGAQSIDFVNRSQVVSALAPGRQIGLQVSGRTSDGRVSYAAGAFNGNSPSTNANDNSDFLYAARAVVSTGLGKGSDEGALDLGASVAHSYDTQFGVPGNQMASFTGRRLLLGTDIRLTSGKALFSAEIVSANLDQSGGPTMKPYGYHVTAGYMVSTKSQLLARWDSFDASDLFTSGGATDWVVLGYNLWPTLATELQVNYIIDVDDSDFKHHQLLLNLQVAF